MPNKHIVYFTRSISAIALGGCAIALGAAAILKNWRCVVYTWLWGIK
ncbi:hypothetical protein [Nostoc sp. CALU 546]